MEKRDPRTPAETTAKKQESILSKSCQCSQEKLSIVSIVCRICYDSNKDEPIITPCRCKVPLSNLKYIFNKKINSRAQLLLSTAAAWKHGWLNPTQHLASYAITYTVRNGPQNTQHNNPCGAGSPINRKMSVSKFEPYEATCLLALC